MPQRWAVLAGVSNTPKEPALPRLSTPENDVRSLREILEDPQRGHFSVESLYDPTLAQLSCAFETVLRKAEDDDLVLLYFSGHGRLSDVGHLGLCTTDCNPEAPAATTFSLGSLRGYLQPSRAKQVLVFLDCCYSGLARDHLKADLGSVLKADLGSVASSELQGAKGLFLVSSASGFELSLALDGDELSLFTKWMIEGIRSGEANKRRDGTLTLDELFQYVYQKVTHQRPQQKPSRWLSLESPGDVIIANVPAPLGLGGVPLVPKPNDPLYRAAEAFRLGKALPFVGPGVYGDGALSDGALHERLTAMTGLMGTQPHALATVAEYAQTLHDSGRYGFIEELGTYLVDEARQLQRPPLLEALCANRQCPILISATYDELLEEAIANSGRPLTVLSHIIRSEAAEHHGRLLVETRTDPGQSSFTSWSADEFDIDTSKTTVIYKLLGAPALNRRASQHFKQDIDTVVITETDICDYLSLMQHQKTRIPNLLGRPLRHQNLLFVGFGLDVWHYRLVSSILRRFPMQARPFALRQSMGVLEARWWEQLRANLVDIDTLAFGRMLLGP